MQKRPPNAGRGRPPGRQNNRTLLLNAKINTLVPDAKLIRLIWKLAEQGDSRCATYLADRKWGKTLISVEVEGEVRNPDAEGPIQHVHRVEYFYPAGAVPGNNPPLASDGAPRRAKAPARPAGKARRKGHNRGVRSPGRKDHGAGGGAP